MAAGTTIIEFTRNLSLIRHPCVRVAIIVVSLMKLRLSPKNAPPTTTATTKGAVTSVASAIPAAMGVSATTVPTLVPMLNDMKQAAINSPDNNKLSGRR